MPMPGAPLYVQQSLWVELINARDQFLRLNPTRSTTPRAPIHAHGELTKNPEQTIETTHTGGQEPQ